jgi:hypothetical protein
MYAERLILETDVSGKLKQVPLLPPNKKLEAIFLVLPESEQTTLYRQPHPDIAGKTKIMGNVIDAAPEAEWNLPK